MRTLVPFLKITIGTPDLHFFLYESYVIFDHKKEKVYVVEENLYSGRSEAEQASSLEQVLAQLARPAKEEFQDKDLHVLHSTIIWSKKSLRIW